MHIPIPLELVDAPDRNLLATVEEEVAERVRPDTEVTVLVPRRRYVGFWRRVLHDIVPFHLASQPHLYAVTGT